MIHKIDMILISSVPKDRAHNAIEVFKSWKRCDGR